MKISVTTMQREKKLATVIVDNLEVPIPEDLPPLHISFNKPSILSQRRDDTLLI